MPTSPSSSSSLVVGWADGDLRVTQISPHVIDVLGYPADEFVGSSLLEHVHPQHAAGLVESAQHVQAARVGVTIRLVARHAKGEWIGLPALLVPRAERSDGLGFVLGESPVIDTAAEARRSAELEKRMWRIAQEVRAAGLLKPESGAAPEAVLSRADFTVREWEVVRLLQDGMRVPSIAATLHVSQSTVRNHLSAIFRKVGVHTQEALLLVLRGASVVE